MQTPGSESDPRARVGRYFYKHANQYTWFVPPYIREAKDVHTLIIQTRKYSILIDREQCSSSVTPVKTQLHIVILDYNWLKDNREFSLYDITFMFILLG